MFTALTAAAAILLHQARSRNKSRKWVTEEEKKVDDGAVTDLGVSRVVFEIMPIDSLSFC